MFQEFKDNDKLKISVAVLLCHIINADDIKSDKEINKFHKIFEKEFNTSKDESIAIYQKIKELNGELNNNIEQIHNELGDDAIVKGKIMQILNEMILSDGIEDNEYKIFEEIREKLF